MQPQSLRFVEWHPAASCYAEPDPGGVGGRVDPYFVGRGCAIGELIVRLFRGAPGAPVPAEFLADGAPQPARETVQVGGHPAELVGNHNLHVYLDDGLAIGITALGTLSLDPDELLRFAEGIRRTGYARPAPR